MRARQMVSHAAGFWVVAAAFLVVMAYSTVPTPLYPLYEQRDGFPVWMITVIFAAYAVGVVVSLFFLGHISDWAGRRRMLLIAILISVVSAVLFLLWSSPAGLIVARLVNGISVGVLTATATAHLSELRARARPGESAIVAASVAGAANLGGLALGPLIGGLFAEFVPDPLIVPHVVFLVALVLAGLAVAGVPETVDAPEAPVHYRPQRLSAPSGPARRSSPPGSPRSRRSPCSDCSPRSPPRSSPARSSSATTCWRVPRPSRSSERRPPANFSWRGSHCVPSS